MSILFWAIPLVWAIGCGIVWGLDDDGELIDNTGELQSLLFAGLFWPICLPVWIGIRIGKFAKSFTFEIFKNQNFVEWFWSVITLIFLIVFFIFVNYGWVIVK